MTRETEIKLRLDSPECGVELLALHRFEILHARIFERNLIFDTPDRQLRSSRRLLRLRQAGPKVTLTFKGPSSTAKHKSREEREVNPGDFDEMRVILERLGYEVSFRYDKFRTEFSRANDQGIATVDETPVGTFMELEGEPAWIDRTAEELGFREADYITASYASLYLKASAKSEPIETVPWSPPAP